jgi:hypothetical protein
VNGRGCMPSVKRRKRKRLKKKEGGAESFMVN